MSTPVLASLAALAFLHLGHPRPSPDRAYELGRWRLDIHVDNFRQQVRCLLSDDYGHFPRIIAGPRILVLKLPGHADGSLAWFSVDGAPARPWRDVEAALIAEGAMAETESLDNATGGDLPLPYSAVGEARTITVQVNRDGRTTRYSTAGLWPTLEAADRLGCRFRQGR